MYKSHREVAREAEVLKGHYAWLYRIFSNQVHASPFSFQAQSNIRGRGLENSDERFYIALAIDVVTRHVGAAIEDMADIFPNQIGNRCETGVDRALEIVREYE